MPDALRLRIDQVLRDLRAAPRERFELCEDDYRTTILALAAAASRGAPPD